jgi:hypothetical protein
MQEGQTRGALKEGDDSGLFVEALLIDLPGLKGGARDLKLLGGLTLRDALSSKVKVLLKEVGTFEPIPSGLAILVALWLRLHYGSHGDLLDEAFDFEWRWLRMARSPCRFNL